MYELIYCIIIVLNNSLTDKLGFEAIDSSNINDNFFKEIAMGIYDGSLYITLGHSWISLQFKVGKNTLSYRVFYGDGGWGNWIAI